MLIDLLAGTARHPSAPPTARPTILVFDSGLGGLTVLSEVRRVRPDADIVYAADDAAFPYGAWSEAALVERVCDVMDTLLALHAPDLVVIACNTASTLVLPALRTRFAVPFVGTVPAVKPAVAASRTGRVSVLATPGTVARDYTRGLVAAYAGGCRVDLVGSVRLAGFAEAEMSGRPVPDAAIRTEIEPCFVDRDGARTDVVALACTHYPLLLDRFRELAPWPVVWIDPAPAIARRVVQIAGESAMGGEPSSLAVFTGTDGPTPALMRALTERGLGDIRLGLRPLLKAA